MSAALALTMAATFALTATGASAVVIGIVMAATAAALAAALLSDLVLPSQGTFQDSVLRLVREVYAHAPPTTSRREAALGRDEIEWARPPQLGADLRPLQAALSHEVDLLVGQLPDHERQLFETFAVTCVSVIRRHAALHRADQQWEIDRLRRDLSALADVTVDVIRPVQVADGQKLLAYLAPSQHQRPLGEDDGLRLLLAGRVLTLLDDPRSQSLVITWALRLMPGEATSRTRWHGIALEPHLESDPPSEADGD